MDSYQQTWMIILIPLFIVYGIIEMRRGWKIIIFKEDSYNVAVQIRIWLLKQFAGDKKLKDYQRYLKQNKTYMQERGFYSFVGSTISLAISIFWLYLLIKL